jgi:hypothetical protein
MLSGLIATALFSYAVLRAARLSFTFDEAATYISYLSSSLMTALDFTDANNHVLYTLLARLFAAFGGSSELVLRLPSLLGFALYLLFSWALLSRFFGRFAALAGFLLINLNPFVLDFFSVGRGYGLALGFEMTALYFFLVFLDRERRSRGGTPVALGAALWAALAAALANLAFLNILVSLWVLAVLFFLIKNWRSQSPPASTPQPQEDGAPGARLTAAAVALSIPFNMVAVAQYVRFSGKSIDPVSVRIRGLNPADTRQVVISGDDIFDREVELPGQDAAWTLPRLVPLKRIKLGFTRATLEKLQGVEIDIGAVRHRVNRVEIRNWQHLRREGLEFFLSGPPVGRRGSVFRDLDRMVNWKGDGVFFRTLAAEAARLIVALAIILGTVFGLGRLAVRWRLLRGAEWRPLRNSVCLSTLYLFYQIITLSRSGALYYGGEGGFIKDTVGSLISESFYGIRYAARQETAVLMFISGSIVVFLSMFAWRRLRRKSPTGHPEAFSLLTFMAVIALLVIAQRAVFRSPYIMGRTAVFLVPLYFLFLLFFMRDLARLGGAWRPAVHLLLTVFVAFSLVHGAHSANLTHTKVWSYDADTKQMVQDIVSLRAGDPSARTRVRLGVHWLCWPASEYYRRTDRLSWLDISMLPTARPCDLLYLPPDGQTVGGRAVIKTYPRTGNVLVQ